MTPAAADSSRPDPRSRSAARVAGLAGPGLVLQNNGADDLVVSANGSFSFKTTVDTGSPYNITVRTQPASPSQGCAVVNAAGTATANVTNVTVTCSTGTFSVGGSVSGLAGSGLVLRNNGGDDLPIASNGSFTFATELASGSCIRRYRRDSADASIADLHRCRRFGNHRRRRRAHSQGQLRDEQVHDPRHRQRPAGLGPGAAEQWRRRRRRANGRRLRVPDADSERLAVPGHGRDAADQLRRRRAPCRTAAAALRTATSTTSSSPARCASSRSAARSTTCVGSGMVITNNGTR